MNSIPKKTKRLTGWLVATAAMSAPLSATAFGLRVDTNRDGVVDMVGLSDEAGKREWTATRGAILLPNIGDTPGRCPRSSDTSFSDAQLEACHDAADNVPRASQNFAPVRTLPVPAATSSQVGRVRAVGRGADKVRLFVQRGGAWVYLGPDSTLTLQEVRRGAVLGADARDVARNASVWDGRVTLEYVLSGPQGEQRDSVVMRVAPLIVYNHTQEATQVFVPRSGGQQVHARFVTGLQRALGDAGFAPPLQRLNTTDNWAQDFVEFAYASMPLPGGRSAMLQVAIRSPQPGRRGGRSVFDLRGPGMGAVQTGGSGYHQTDSFGNLETVPPHSLNGKHYPVGRIVYGDAGDGLAPHPDMRQFFAAQELQSPIVLDTSWLVIGHVDEFLQFLPADTPRGWRVAIADVAAGLAVLRQAQAAGHGGVKAYSVNVRRAPKVTINELLADEAFLRANALAVTKIAENLALLQRETGLTAAEVVGVPTLFQASEFTGPAAGDDTTPPPGGGGALENIVYGPGTLIAAYPAAINSLLLDRRNVVAPRAWGPVIGGRDVLQDAVTAAYANAGFTVRYVDDWRSHHVMGGEVHCGTNATRRARPDWWR
jgi:protein-arginine deiminase